MKIFKMAHGDPATTTPQATPPVTKIQFVTAFFSLHDLSSPKIELSRSELQMWEAFSPLARSGLPIIVFVDYRMPVITGWPENVRFVPADVTAMWAFTWDDGERKPLPRHRKEEKDTRAFLLLQNSKLEFLRMATDLADDEYTHFAWIDFGIMKISKNHDEFIEKLRALNPGSARVLAPGCWPKSDATVDDDQVNWRFCGGFFVADRVNATATALLHREEMKASLKLTWEVNNWAKLEMKYGPETFTWYKADHDDTLIRNDRHVELRRVTPDAEVKEKFELGPAGLASISPRICLTMIVKNEAKIIERCLAAALPYIDTWCITDTGSSDDTVSKIVSFFSGKKVPGSLARGEFHNYAQARNMSLDNARMSAEIDGGKWDYALLIDADMVLTGTLDKTQLTAPAYKIVQKNGHIDYFNTRLVRRDVKAEYVSVTHEYLSVEGVEPLLSLVIDDRDDGGNKPEKAERDIRLLNEGLLKEPGNGRYMFYLAQTYKGTGRFREAILWYTKRVEVGGWDEEVWYAKYSIAQCYAQIGDEANFIKASLEAYEFRPSRGEPLKMLAQFYRTVGKNELSVLVAQVLSQIPYPTDELFVERDVYDYGAAYEIAISGFYSKVPRRREEGYLACANLTTHSNEWVRNEARKNFTFYARSASDFYGAGTREIDWKPEDGWAPMNPSVFCGNDFRRLVLVRTVNYKVADGQYPTIDGSGIIRTKNYVLEMSRRWQAIRSHSINDDSRRVRSNFPVEGFEDCRLWCDEHYYASITIRDQADNPDGHCEMAIARLDENWNAVEVTPIRDYEYEKTQKNWMPVIGRPGVFLYSCDPTIVIDTVGSGSNTKEIARSIPSECLADLRGGSQLIPFGAGWLCITHEVAWRPERVYLHRFVRFSDDFKVTHITDPFYFQRIGIEFCAGLTRDGDQLIASYGVNDASAHLAFFSLDAVNRSLRPLRDIKKPSKDK